MCMKWKVWNWWTVTFAGEQVELHQYQSRFCNVARVAYPIMSFLLFSLHQSQTSIFPGRSAACGCAARCAALHCDWMECFPKVDACQIYTVRRRAAERGFFFFFLYLRSSWAAAGWNTALRVKGRRTPACLTESMCNNWPRFSGEKIPLLLGRCVTHLNKEIKLSAAATMFWQAKTAIQKLRHLR